MLPARGERHTVSCIACGARLPRSEAREYDKQGDRWLREGKSFEYLCKPCFRDLSKAPRDGLEDRLMRVGAGRIGRDEFVSRYLEAERRADRSSPEREHE